MEELSEVIKKRILEAFRDTPYPGDENLVADQSGYDPESREVAKAFRGKDWRNVSAEMVREYACALPLFTPVAFRYYLPAYMYVCASSYYDLGVALNSVIFNLTPPKEPGDRVWDFFWARVQKFNESERNAIKAFLHLIHQYECADWATSGMEPPENRMGPVLDFWSE